MAGLNEQQGYVLKLTSAEGYKEERVEVGIERNNLFCFFLINSALEIQHEKPKNGRLQQDVCFANALTLPLFTFTLNILFSHPEITE